MIFFKSKPPLRTYDNTEEPYVASRKHTTFCTEVRVFFNFTDVWLRQWGLNVLASRSGY